MRRQDIEGNRIINLSKRIRRLPVRRLVHLEPVHQASRNTRLIPLQVLYKRKVYTINFNINIEIQFQTTIRLINPNIRRWQCTTTAADRFLPACC